METRETTVEESHAKQRLDKFLGDALPHLTRARIQGLIKASHLTRCGQVITSPSHKVRTGETYTLTIPPAIEALPQAEDIPLTIIFEDADLLVINKPVGMVVHPAPGNRASTLVNALLAHCGNSLSGIGGVRRPGIVHRLDKDTSGLMVVAKNDLSHQGLASQFTSRTLTRSYWAFVWGCPFPKENSIENTIGRSPCNRQKMAVVTRGGKLAITRYQVLQRFFSKVDASQAVSWIQCHLETGRTHQIRVHLAHIGHPLLGDPLYGRLPKWAKKAFHPDILAFPRQALHAYELSFQHPRTLEMLTFEASLPPDLEKLKESLEGSANKK